MSLLFCCVAGAFVRAFLLSMTASWIVFFSLMPPFWSSSSSSEVISTHSVLVVFLGVGFLIAIPFFTRTCPLSATGFPPFFFGVTGPVERAAAVLSRCGSTGVFPFCGWYDSWRFSCDLWLHFGQTQSPVGSSVTWTHSQWYHFTGQSSPSQQIHFVDASGSPQSHL